MSLAAFAGIFGLLFVLELPDKTMVATIVMSTRARPVLVWLGASWAFVVQMAIAAVAGGFLAKLPHTPKEIVVALLFLGGAAYLLFVPEKKEEEKGTREGGRERKASKLKEFSTAFTVIFIGEFGDLSQIQAANMVARTHQPFLVFVAASSALICVAALGAFAGQSLIKRVPLAKVRLVGGLIFLALGVYTMVGLFR